MQYETTTVRKSRGWRRYHELKQQDEAAKAEILAGLLDGLGRMPTMADRIAAEQIAALVVWARVLERRGALKAAAEVRQQVTQATRASGLKPAPVEKQKVDPSASAVEWLNSFKKPSTDAPRTTAPASGPTVDGAV